MGRSALVHSSSTPLIEFGWVGDSITRGAGSTNDRGLRKPASDLCIANGYAYDAVGTLTNGDYADNQHDGLAAAEIASRATLITNSYGVGKTISRLKGMHLMIGTNDLRSGTYVEAVRVAAWAALVNQIRTAFPNIRLFVGEPIPINAAVDATAAARLPGFITGIRAANTNCGAVLIDYSPAFPNGWEAGLFFDEYHPNDDGYAAMWTVLRPYLEPVFAVAA